MIVPEPTNFQHGANPSPPRLDYATACSRRFVFKPPARLCVLIAVLLLIVLAYLFPRVFSKHYEDTSRRHCAVGLQAIGLMLIQYTNLDAQGRFPSRLDQLYPGIHPSLTPLICPSSFDRRIDTPYIYLGARLTKSVSDNTIVVYESIDNHDKEGMNVLYADGRVEWIPARKATLIIKELQAGHNPPQ